MLTSGIVNSGIKSDYLSHCFIGKQTGYVHSIFSNSLNIQFENFLFHISNGNEKLSSFGCEINSLDFEYIKENIVLNDFVKSDGEMIYFYFLKERVAINLRSFQVVSLKIRSIGFQKESCLDTLKLIQKYLSEEKIGLPLNTIAQIKLSSLVETSLAKEEIISALLYLCGRGKGLTPSGDDILQGYLFVTFIFDAVPKWISYLKQGLLDNKLSTTDISLAYYQTLFFNYVNEPLLKFNIALERDNQTELIKNIQSIQAIGHTSGNDILLGIYLGFKYILNYKEDVT